VECQALHLSATGGFDGLLLEAVEKLNDTVDVFDKNNSAGPRKVVADDDAHELHVGDIRWGGVGRHDPAALAEARSDVKFVIVQVAFLEAESDHRKAIASAI